MSQTNAILSLVSSTRGSALRQGLVALNGAVLTGHSGATAAAHFKKGTTWWKQPTGAGSAVWTRVVQEADGANATAINMGAADTTNHVYRVALDRDADSYVAATSTDDVLEVVTGGAQRMTLHNTGISIGSSGGSETLKLLSPVPMQIGMGTTAQRPSSPAEGMFWYNTDLDRLEYYDTAWRQVAITTDGRETISDLTDVVITGVPSNGQGLVWDASTGRWVNDAVSVADGGITTAKLADGAVTTPKIADGAVTAAKVANGAIGDAQLKDDAVHTSKINNGAVTDAKLASKVTAAANGATQSRRPTGTKIADNAVTAAKIRLWQRHGGAGARQRRRRHDVVAEPDGQRGRRHPGRSQNRHCETRGHGAVTSVKIASGAVTNAKVANNGIGAGQLSVSGNGTAGQVLASGRRRHDVVDVNQTGGGGRRHSRETGHHHHRKTRGRGRHVK